MRRSMTNFQTISLFISLFFLALPAKDVPTFIIRMNGHSYPQEQDLVKRSLQERFDLTFDTSGLDSLIDSLAQAYDISVTQYMIPDSFSIGYLVDSSGVNDFVIFISQEDWFIQAAGFGCQFDITISDFGLKLGGTSGFSEGEFKVTLAEPEIAHPGIMVSDSGNIFCPLIGAAIQEAISQQIDSLIAGLNESLTTGPAENLFAFLNPFGLLAVEDPDLILAAVKSFPMNMRLYTEETPLSGTAQLVLEINFLLGTVEDSTAFSGIEPEASNGSYLDNGGFSYLYWGLQRGYPWHTDWDETQRVDAAFTAMDEYEINGYRIEPRWNEIQIQAYTGAELDPDNITSGMIDDFIGNTTYWDTTAYNRTRRILEDGKEKNFVPMMALGVGYEDRMPVTATGLRIAPAGETWQPVEGTIAVSANEYLYNLKIFAHATVRRFAPYIKTWQIENELNAAGFAAAVPEWWRKGDLWQEDTFRNRVWKTLVTAVKEEDPQAQISHNLHMLGFMQGLENWVEDMDIVGFSFYPNQVTAIPNLGFAVGEYVWAVRRALKGLNYNEKPVWVIETGFPGITRDDSPDTLLLDEDLVYFSESRQADYVKTALSSAVENGANGFYYFSLTTPEDTLSARINNRFMRYSGLIRRDSDEPKPALSVFSDLFNTYFQATGIINQLTGLPQKVLLFQNYPNPFNPATTINYELPFTNYVEISVYDILGQKVATLVNEHQKAGQYQVELDASGFASGIYYYKLKAGDFVDVKKMILLR